VDTDRPQVIFRGAPELSSARSTGAATFIAARSELVIYASGDCTVGGTCAAVPVADLIELTR